MLSKQKTAAAKDRKKKDKPHSRPIAEVDLAKGKSVTYKNPLAEMSAKN
jgi:hypothetical protein